MVPTRGQIQSNASPTEETKRRRTLHYHGPGEHKLPQSRCQRPWLEYLGSNLLAGGGCSPGQIRRRCIWHRWLRTDGGVDGMHIVVNMRTTTRDTRNDLALSLTQNIRSGEFTVLLILVILFVTVFFCHGLIRLCMIIFRLRPDDDARPRMPQPLAPGGYAVPREPIRVVLARDEEEQGEVSEALLAKPPAYGLWRESVRVDPNRIYWQRNPNAASNAGPPTSEGSHSGPRPPSYASEDGVSYVVDARPRSMAPAMTDVSTPPHLSEVGRLSERQVSP
ncbi:hypothetical protein LX32DRAFT_689665 [Colletotrichum zoysiae]|uniref:Uncharacterized protein n=1 Tax=Colletotrichum zoysiae TaxID=1216348 RepID=A0AAD9HRR5_9PEZI|nr:hypothetical protein LX32DRAFT_689665 [Colletotrichum zoysiae]